MPSTRIQSFLGDVFTSILPLQNMLDKVPLVSLKEALLELLNVDLKSIEPLQNIDEHMSTLACSRLCDAVLESARDKPVMSLLPPKIQGLDTDNFIGALMVHTMEKPFPWYVLYTFPLNMKGERNVQQLRHQLSFLKLLIFAFHIMPRNSSYWFTDPLYRGIDVKKSPILLEKIANYKKYFAPGTKITFAAPTSTSTDPDIAAEFTDGIQFLIYGVGGIGGPGGVLLEELSMFEEREVLLDFPRVFVVTACTKPDRTLFVVLQETGTSMTYISNIEVLRSQFFGGAASLALSPPPTAAFASPLAGSPRLRQLVESAGLSLSVNEIMSRLRSLAVVSASDLEIVREDWKELQPSLGLAHVDSRKFAKMLDRYETVLTEPVDQAVVSPPPAPPPPAPPPAAAAAPPTPACAAAVVSPPPAPPPPAQASEGGWRRTLASFGGSEQQYATYLQATLRPGMRVVAVQGERRGDHGTYIGTNGLNPPCNVKWSGFGSSYWVFWRDVEIFEG